MTMYPEEASAPATSNREFEAGPDQVLVLYQPPDTGAELSPEAIYEHIAADATKRDRDGMRIVSMHAMPLRHAGTAFGNDGSGYQTKVMVVVVYERRRGATS
jgi:hypothetical protein